MEVENLDELSPPELDALLERALNPQVPVEVLYAVLERIGPATRDAVRDGARESVRDGGSADAATTVMAAVPVPPSPGVPEPDAEAATVMAPLPPLPQDQLVRGAATDRAVRPERPLPPKQPTPTSSIANAVNLANAAAGPAQQTPSIPVAQPQPQPQPQPAQPPSASPSVPPSRGAHAVTRRPVPPPPESGH